MYAITVVELDFPLGRFKILPPRKLRFGLLVGKKALRVWVAKKLVLP